MANREHLAKLKEGVEAWNEWRATHREITPDLVRAKLGGARLGRANLSGANLHRAELGGAILAGANLAGSNCTEAHLFRADLGMSNLAGALLDESSLLEANLAGAILSDAVLFGANLNSAALDLCDLSRASVGTTSFGDNDLSLVTGLETVQHVTPSTIGLDTIYKSKGKIPEVFLRGCGVPDDFITYAKSLVANPIEFYSCFISYSGKDQEFAERLHTDLQGKGVRCWFAPHDIKGGKKLEEQIDTAIRVHDKLLLILSEHSMESEWVLTEIAKARKREIRDKRRVLFPIRLVPFRTVRDWKCFDADTGKDSAREIREYFIPDFSDWKNHDSFQKAFQRLLDDLRAQDSPATP
jgi:TIR domain-containing protein/pentapeptide repeat protein